MKHSYCFTRVLSLLFAFVLGLSVVSAKDFVLVIDAGHGGRDAGALGNKAKEKDINLGVALKLGRMVANNVPGVKVVYTRDKDVYLTLQERADKANRVEGDLFISIHTNSIDKKSPNRKTVHRSKENLEVAKRENSVIYLENDFSTRYEGFDPNSTESYIIFEFMQYKHMEQSINFASDIQHEFVSVANRVDRGVRQAGFWVLAKTGMPAVLVELDFICNPTQERFLTSESGQTKMAQAIYNAVVASTTPIQLTAGDVTVEYNTDKSGLTHISYVPLSETDITGLVKFGTGEWEIRISWPGNQQYRGDSVTVKVTTTDKRLVSAVALKPGVSFTYNMDPSVMEQAIFDNVIDWDNSTLPARETLSPDNFTMEYYGTAVLFDGGIDSGIQNWVPVEGKSYDLGELNLGTYPQLGAGENQQIRVSFNGNADYRPSETTKGTVTVNKATVKVKVHSDNIYADEALPEGFITTDPADEFDQYVIYAGVTSNVTTALYLDLPDRYDDNAFIKILDPVVEAIAGKSFTQMLNDGVTVGELRELLSTEELLDLLDKLNIDTGTFGQILEAVNKMPGILDSVRISFGAPSRAGLYTVAVVTDNQNYETGFGMGFLLVKMRLSGVHLTWNQELGSKISAADAQNFDFGATLSYDGDPTISQESVSYLYSGFTSKWRVYSSTTTPPTEPGRYVMTVVTLGGNYQAAPITRSVQITT